MKCNHQVRQEMASRWIRSKRPCYERRVNRVLESVLVGGGLGLVAALKTHVLAILLALAGLTTTASAVDSSFMDLGTLGGEYVDVQTISDDGSVVVGGAENADGNNEAFIWTQTGGMVGLGTLGGNSSFVKTVSGNGSVVVGWSRNADDNREAFVWTQTGGMVGLGTLGGDSSSVKAVSFDGSVVVGTSNYADDHEEVFVWTQTGGMVALGTLGGDDSWPEAVSGDGSVVVGTSYNADGNNQPFVWTQTGGMMVSPGSLGGEYGSSRAVSFDGSVVVGTSQNADEYEEAFAWTQSGGMVGLGILPGQEYSYGYFVSDDGSVVFGLTEGDDEDEVFVWTQSGGMVGLGILEEEGSEIEAISADGSIAVGMANDTEVGFLWDNVNGMRDLTEVLIADNSLESSLAGWDYLRAKGVSSDGLTVTIVGNGELDDSACEGCYNTRGWIARIESPVVPEPSSLILLGIALACLFGNARRSV